jgi:ABC-type nitrate/sulfonate/bicarbonate transport system substrate-binding protein
MRNEPRLLASLLFVLVICSCDASATERLRVAFPSLGIALSPSWVTLEKGLWRKYGLDVELILLSGGARTVPALLSGSVQILLASDPTVTQAIAQGTDLMKLGVTTNTFGAALLTQPDIESVKDLKGKVLGVARGRDASYARLIKLLRDNGINPNDDVKLLAIGEGPGARLNALKAKVIQGTILSPPLDLVASKEGLRVLEKLDVPTPAGGISTTGNFLRQHRAVLLNFLKGYIEGIHYLLTRKDESIKVLSRYLRNPDMAVVGYFYDEIARRAEKDLRPAPESIRFLNDLVALDEPKAKQLTETDHWDLSLIEQIRKTGFVDQLYRN